MQTKGDQGEEQDPILHAILVQRDTKRERERKRESSQNRQKYTKFPKPKNTELITSKSG